MSIYRNQFKPTVYTDLGALPIKKYYNDQINNVYINLHRILQISFRLTVQQPEY